MTNDNQGFTEVPTTEPSYSYTPPVAPPPAKKSNWLVIVLVVLLLCCCLSIAGVGGWWFTAGQYQYDITMMVDPLLALL